MHGDPQSVQSLLRTRSSLQALGKRIKEHGDLLERVRRHLPAPVAPHCVAVVPAGKRIALYADSPAWASRLRYLIPDLLDALASETPGIAEIRTRILLEDQRSRSSRSRQIRRLSIENGQLMLQTADSLSDPALSSAFRRLASHRKA